MTQRTILLVDDQCYYLRSLIRELHGSGFAVDVVASAAETADRLAAGRLYDLAIVDLNLPSGSPSRAGVSADTPTLEMGWRVIEMIRETPGPNAGLPVVVFSAYVDTTPKSLYSARSKALQVVATLRKGPGGPEQLVATVRRLLSAPVAE